MNDNPIPVQQDEVDLGELLATIWSGRKLIMLVTALFGIAATAYVLLVPPWYKAEVVLAPSGQQSLAGGALGGLSSLSRLAGLAGVTVPNGADTQPVAVLKSNDLAKDFIVDMKIMPALLEGMRAG